MIIGNDVKSVRGKYVSDVENMRKNVVYLVYYLDFSPVVLSNEIHYEQELP